MCKLDLARWHKFEFSLPAEGDVNEEGGTLGLRRDAAPTQHKENKVE